MPTVNYHPPKHKGRQAAPPTRARCRGCRGRTSPACIVALHCNAACPPYRLRGHRHAAHLCARVAHHGRPSIRILQQQNVLLKGMTLSRLLACYEPISFSHSLQPACTFTERLWRRRGAQGLFSCAVGQCYLSPLVQAGSWSACSSDCLVQARTPIWKSRSWVSHRESAQVENCVCATPSSLYNCPVCMTQIQSPYPPLLCSCSLDIKKHRFVQRRRHASQLGSMCISALLHRRSQHRVFAPL